MRVGCSTKITGLMYWLGHSNAKRLDKDFMLSPVPSRTEHGLHFLNPLLLELRTVITGL